MRHRVLSPTLLVLGGVLMSFGLISVGMFDSSAGGVSIDLTGGEIIGFVLFCLGVAPVLIWMSRLGSRVSRLEELLSDSARDRTRLHDKLDEIFREISHVRENCAAACAHMRKAEEDAHDRR